MTTPPATYPTFTIAFASEEDAKRFEKFIAEALKRDGTPAPLQTSLLAMALKRATYYRHPTT